MKIRGRVLALVLLIVAVFAVLAFAQAKKAGADQQFTGVVTDSMCGEKHTMMPGKSDAECVRACVKAGSNFALLSGNGHVYVLQGKNDELDKYAAQKVTVNGRLNGNTIEVASVGPTK